MGLFVEVEAIVGGGGALPSLLGTSVGYPCDAYCGMEVSLRGGEVGVGAWLVGRSPLVAVPAPASVGPSALWLLSKNSTFGLKLPTAVASKSQCSR